MSETVFWVLTAMGDGPRHGYAVLREAERLSGGQVALRVTTLYATLERLQRNGLVDPAGDAIVDGRARRYFALTDDGRSALEEETASLEMRARAARAALTPSPRPAAGARPAAAQ